MDTHVRVLGVLNILLGAVGLAVALFVLLALGGVAGLMGVAAVEEPDAWIAAPILGLVAMVIFTLLVAISLPCVIGGIGLLQFRPWARILVIILSVINLVNFPFGTIIGLYGLWVLLSRETEALFTAGAAAPPPSA